MADCFFKYMMKNFPTELVVMGAKTALNQLRLAIGCFEDEELRRVPFTRYGKYVMNAMDVD